VWAGETFEGGENCGGEEARGERGVVFGVGGEGGEPDFVLGVEGADAAVPGHEAGDGVSFDRLGGWGVRTGRGGECDAADGDCRGYVECCVDDGVRGCGEGKNGSRGVRAGVDGKLGGDSGIWVGVRPVGDPRGAVPGWGCGCDTGITEHGKFWGVGSDDRGEEMLEAL